MNNWFRCWEYSVYGSFVTSETAWSLSVSFIPASVDCSAVRCIRSASKNFSLSHRKKIVSLRIQSNVATVVNFARLINKHKLVVSLKIWLLIHSMLTNGDQLCFPVFVCRKTAMFLENVVCFIHRHLD